MASATSKKIELKLTGVARASLEELKLDFEDYLENAGLSKWSATDPLRSELIAKRCQTIEQLAAWIREIHGRNHGESTSSTQSIRSTRSTQSIRSTPSTTTRSTYPEITANTAIILIVVATSLLDRQIASLEKAFVHEGGFTERMQRVRYDWRKHLRKR